MHDSVGRCWCDGMFHAWLPESEPPQNFHIYIYTSDTDRLTRPTFQIRYKRSSFTTHLSRLDVHLTLCIMVFLKRNCPPGRRKAIIAVDAILSSATLAVGGTETVGQGARFELRISLSIAESTRPGEAITICTDKSVFAPAQPEDELDTLAQKTASLVSTSDSTRRINLGQYIIGAGRRRTPPPADLKERPLTHLLTIPADGEVVVVHDLSPARVFKYEDRLTPADVVGEIWRLQLSEGTIGTPWWCWGDLASDLKDKRLSAWREGLNHQTTPRPEGDEWVLGCDTLELVFEDRTQDATFRFVA
jgi:hypothetical protein